MDKRTENLVAILKNGSGIHIKKANRGKFTDYCGGKVTSACIARGKASPNPAIRKRATFAANARKWKHEEGGVIGEKDTVFEDLLKSGKYSYNPVYISYINNKLREAGMSKTKRASVLANIIPESAGDPFAKSPDGFYGLLQWAGDRYNPTNERNVYAELDNQINYILQTERNAIDKKSWTHGGTGSGYRSLTDAIEAFNSDNINNSMRGFTLGYVRPANALDTLKKRSELANDIYNHVGFYKKGSNLIFDFFNKYEKSNKKEESNKEQIIPLIYRSPDYTKRGIPEIDQFLFEDYSLSYPVLPVNVDFVKNDNTLVSSEPTIKVEEQSEQKAEEEKEEETPLVIAEESPVEEVTEAVINPGIIEYASNNMNVGNMRELIDLMKKEGISFRVTSGLRPGAITKSGNTSKHALGYAIDIVPIKGQTFEDLIEQIRRSAKVLEYMRSHNIGLLDERTKEMLAKTGGTGPHFHIGTDLSAINNFKQLFG